MMIKIKRSERASFVGTTGSGKTVLARYLLYSGGERVLIIDPKHTFTMGNVKAKKKLPLFSNKFKMIYRPNRDDDRHLAELLREVYKRGNTRIFTDEIGTLAQYFPMSTATLEDIARTGRERDISLWNATQRPRHVPIAIFSESEVWFAFLLRDPEDRKRIKGFVGAQVNDPIDLYNFWYVRPGMVEPELLHLNLETRKIERVTNERVTA